MKMVTRAEEPWWEILYCPSPPAEIRTSIGWKNCRRSFHPLNDFFDSTNFRSLLLHNASVNNVTPHFLFLPWPPFSKSLNVVGTGSRKEPGLKVTITPVPSTYNTIWSRNESRQRLKEGVNPWISSKFEFRTEMETFKWPELILFSIENRFWLEQNKIGNTMDAAGW